MPASVKKNTLLHKIYGADVISERHRHKYEFNPAFYRELEKNGLVFSVKGTADKLYEAFELPIYRFYVGVIYRPEFKSRPDNPHPLITAFIGAAKERGKK